MRGRSPRTACALLAFVPFTLYACGALKDGEDRAQLPDASDGANDARGDALRDAIDDRDASVVDASGDAPDALDAFDANDAFVRMDASDARDAMLDAEADIVDGGPPVQIDAPIGSPIPLVLGSSAFQLIGFTSDGYFIYRDQGSIYAVSLADGARELIFGEPPDSSALPWASIQGRVVIADTGGLTNNAVAVVWTHASGPRPAPANLIDVRASNDGSRLGYTIVSRYADGGVADIQFALSDVDLSNPVVFPTVPARAFPFGIGVTANHFLVPRENFDVDADPSSDGLDSYATDGTQTRLFDRVSYWASNDEVVVMHGPRSFQARSAGGGPTTTIDVPGDGGALDPVGVTPDGAHVVFGDGTAGFWASPTSSASPVNLPGTDALGGGISYLVMAPDSLHFAAWLKGGKAIVARMAPGGAITIPYSGATGQFVAPPDFSADSRYMFASYTALTALTAIAVDTGTSTRISLDIDCSGSCWQRAHGATVLYLTKGSLYSVDVDHIASPSLLGNSVVRFMANAAGTVVVSLVKDPASEASSGLFVSNVP